MPNRLLLDYETWKISPDNFIQFGKSGILANEFNLSQNNQLLSINSINSTPNAPLKVEFKNFEIETLTKFAETDTAMIGGTINGLIDVKDLVDNPKFEANLNISKPVSYTHLDVYKRQIITCAPDNLASVRGIQNAGFSRLKTLGSVVVFSRWIVFQRNISQ